MKKISTMTTNRNKISKEPKLTIGLDLGDRSSHYCILDEAGNVILETQPADHTERNPPSLQQDPA
jgi:transposase